MTWMSRANFIRQYGKNFYRRFVETSKKNLKEILSETPDIGDSIFEFNYLYGPCYFSWYAALRSAGLDQETALQKIWQINEDLVKNVPEPIMHWFARNMYLGVFRKKAVEAERRGKAGLLHPFDWRVEYLNIDEHNFGINIYECGMLKLAKKFGYLEMFPAVCRMDYLFSHYFDNGFMRSGTLADGNLCCDCRYQFPGQCEWAPEKGFVDRK
jgi:hypothetical protein